MKKIILHCFQWNLVDIIRELQTIKNCGYNAIQISPINLIKEGPEWWTYYQPLAFRIGNKSGTRKDLIRLCKEAKALGIEIIVDVVLRHTANIDGEEGANLPAESVDNVLKNNPYVWTNSKNITDYDDRYQVVHGSFNLPMLNYYNHDLQDIFIEFLQDLKTCGVNGFRVDMGKHFALPEEGCDFWPRVFGPFRDMFNYAECLGSSTELLDKYTSFINVITDGGNPSDMTKLVAFVMSHDTELNEGGETIRMNDELIIKEWQFLLENYSSHVLFYCRRKEDSPNSDPDLWKSDSIREINLGIAKNEVA